MPMKIGLKTGRTDESYFIVSNGKKVTGARDPGRFINKIGE